MSNTVSRSGTQAGASTRGRVRWVARLGIPLAMSVVASLPAFAMTGCMVILPGCGSYAPTIETKRTSQIPHVADAPIEVKSQNGSIAIEKHEGAEVTISAVLRGQTQERLDATRVLAERKADNSLVVFVQWPEGGRLNNEGCDFKIEIPGVKGVTAQSSNGSITLVGLAGDLKADSSNGAITVRMHEGDVAADTSNGGVTIDRVSGKVKASTSNGDVSVSLADEVAGPVDIGTSNGSVGLEVGRLFVGTLRVSTSNGSLTVPSGDGIVETSKTKRSAELVFGKGGQASVVKTSNGSVTVKRR